jgi:hypothetical protein
MAFTIISSLQQERPLTFFCVYVSTVSLCSGRGVWLLAGLPGYIHIYMHTDIARHTKTAEYLLISGLFASHIAGIFSGVS